MSSALLAVDALVAGYEPGSPIVNGVSLVVAPGELVAVFGPNGAGKSTLIKAIAGLVPVTDGRIAFDGCDLRGLPPHRIVRLGLAYVPQTDNVFATLSVDDNLALAAQLLAPRLRRGRIGAALELFADLVPKRRDPAGRLSGGQRQMLAIARALIVAPRLLVLDEPSAGLAPKVVSELFGRLREIRATGIGIVLVEQNVRAALGISDRVYVLAEGRNRLDGPAAALAAEPAIATLLLGRRAVPAGLPA